jgi:hypothetical protein
MSERPLREIADGIAEEVSGQRRRFSPKAHNKLIATKPEQFEIARRPVEEEAFKVFKSSLTNEMWLRQQSREKRQQRFLKGEFIPSVSQMQLYGRKEQPSR